MRFISIFLLVSILLGSSFSTTYADPMVSLKQPPASLQQWYKPENKRQVWLHTMFKLRREMQAIAESAERGDQPMTEKWIKRLDKNYNKIAEMVPEWEDAIKPRLLSELELFADKRDTPRLLKTLKMIQRTCDDCHTYYQPLVTATYRSPDYAGIKVKGGSDETQSFEKNMELLSQSLNRTLIALDDGQQAMALQSSQRLVQQLKDLATSCSSCHQDDVYPVQRILGKDTERRLAMLQTNIEQGKVKDSQKLMGEIAVTVCARCHNTHRIISDLRGALMPEAK